jgi:hypothetical protein
MLNIDYRNQSGTAGSKIVPDSTEISVCILIDPNISGRSVTQSSF